ncbi:N-acetylmuramoyl-L-alanine amidase [Lihuaxuella thermophila]|uniref:N-acetylmuramoyl-L-alanine amidase n=1 Tax=Lihuaxuella thermophila TaxID=1173111 RepID=A0A1H8GFA0_9BACL|nr:N-acetylmuramoyl-L-alanine amidase [Lihuaxuella thermophila]SEN42682.1 N-acetylmuramoyl-L-alanine amidase [Lihuaxuella thermophila]
MSFKIMIDPGHGGHDSGAIGNGLREKDLTLAVSKAIKQELMNYAGVEVRLTRENDRYVDLADRCAMANRWGADFFLSIHINSGGGNGFESYVYRAASAKSRTAQDQIHAAVTAVTNAKGWKDRGKKEAGFYVIKNTRMPALLTENGFIDTEGNADDLKQTGFIQALAVAHAKGIAAAFGLKRKVPTPPPPFYDLVINDEGVARVSARNPDELAAAVKKFVLQKVDKIILEKRK